MKNKSRLGGNHPARKLNGGGKKAFAAYDATASSPHRSSPATTIKGGDVLLNKNKRKIGAATVQEQMTNSALLAWAVRKHVDYVSRFEINFRSGNPELDKEVKSLLGWHGRRANFDLGKRHSRNQWMRIFELNKIMNGDAVGIKVKGGKLQGIDSTQISKPQDWNKNSDTNKQKKVSDFGLILGKLGEVLEYCVCTRNKNNRLIFDHFEKAENILFDGIFTGFNQTRGHSPLLAAMNDCIDLSDIVLYSKIKLKLANIFGLAVFRDTADSLGNPSFDDDGEPEAVSEISPEQINILDLNQNDKIEKFETNSPGANSIEFMGKLTQIVMLSLDIPYTSFDSSKASFSARIGDRAEYEESAEFKRDKNIQILLEIYAWRITDWYNTNKQFKTVADKAGFDAGRIIRGLDIIPNGTPWLDKLNGVKGDILSVAGGFESIPRLAKKHGVDAYEILHEQAEFLKKAKEMGVPIFYANGGQEAVQNILNENSEADNNTGGTDNE